MKSLAAAALSLALLLTAASGASAQSVSPGKNVAYSFLTNTVVGTSFSSVAQVGILKGRKKRIVEVDVKIIDRQLVADALGAYVTVNGVQMNPGSVDVPQMTQCNHNWINCTLVAHFWADLDTLELANPGMFKNVPLTFDVQGIARGTATNNATISVRARMMKK